MTYLRLRRADRPDRSPFFEVVPLTYDEQLRDYREEAARIYATSIHSARALTPVGSERIANHGLLGDATYEELWECTDPRRRRPKVAA